MKKRILFFIETGGPGGAEQVVLQLLEGFKTLGHEVFLATLRTGWLTKTAVERGFEYHQIPSEQGLDLALPFKIARLVKNLEIDAIHTHLLDSNFYGSIAAKIAGVSHIGTEHGDVHHINKKKFLKLKLLVASSGRSKLTSVSEYSLKKLITLGVSKNKCSVVPNPLKEPTGLERREKARESLNATSEWLWLHVGNLRPVKDQATLIRGFAHSASLTSEGQKLIIVGGGDELQKLVSLSEELKIKDKVIFVGHSDDVELYLSASDGFIMSSLSESMPMALLEAISYSLYPICSNVGGIPEILSPEQIFPVGNFKNLGELCTRVLENKDQHRATAKEFSDRMRVDRSLLVVCKQYLSLYGG